MMRAQLAVAVALAGLAVLVAGTEPAAAKTPHWVITGGDLDGAWMFHGIADAETEVHLPGDAVVLHEVPAVGGVTVYDVYPSCGMVECIAVQLEAERPPMRYFAGTGILWGRPWLTEGPDHWYQLNDAQVALLDGAVGSAKAAALEGGLPADAIEAHLLGIGLQKNSTFTFSPGYTPGADFGLAQRPRFAIEPPASSTFALEGLAGSLRGGVRGQSSEPPAWSILLWVAWDTSGGGWGGPMGAYSPPFDGQAGRLFLGPRHFGVAQDYWETTREFDMAVATALSSEGVTVAWPAPPAAGTGVRRAAAPELLIGFACLGLSLTLAEAYWLKSITSRGGPSSSKTRKGRALERPMP